MAKLQNINLLLKSRGFYYAIAISCILLIGNIFMIVYGALKLNWFVIPEPTVISTPASTGTVTSVPIQSVR